MSARADLGFATNLSRADVSMELSQVFTYDILDWLETDDLTVPTVVARRLQAPPTLTLSCTRVRVDVHVYMYVYTAQDNIIVYIFVINNFML